MAGGGLVLVAVICFGIVMFEKKRSNRKASSTSPVSEMTPVASAKPVETAAPTVAATTPPLPSPVTTVAQSTAAPVVTETVSANSVANSTPSMTTPPSSVVPQPGYAMTPSVSSVDGTEAVRQFVRDYFAALSSHELNTVVSMFADNVDYQGQGHHDRRYIRNDTQKYFRRWDRIYFEVGDIDVSHTGDGDLQVKFNFPFAVGQGYASDKRGVSSQVWILRRQPGQPPNYLATGKSARRWLRNTSSSALEKAYDMAVWYFYFAFVLRPNFSTRLTKAATERSEETETVEEPATTPTPVPAKKSKASKGEPTVGLGTKSPSSRPDGLSIAKPPSQLDPGSTSSPAATNFLVAIDIGHTKNQGGAISARGVSVHVFNERLSRELFNSLQAAHQFRSLLINPGGGDIGLVKRAQVANQRNADLFIAIHHDSVKDSFLKEWAFGGRMEKYSDDFTVSRFFSLAKM